MLLQSKYQGIFTLGNFLILSGNSSFLFCREFTLTSASSTIEWRFHFHFCVLVGHRGEFTGKFIRWLGEFPLQQRRSNKGVDLRVNACGRERYML